MTSVSRDISIHAPSDVVWDAVRDVGAVHERLLPGLVSATTVVPDGRLVSFGNGMLVRERILDVDDDSRRLVHTLNSGWSCHYVSVMRVNSAGAAHCRLLWTVDYRPDRYDLMPRVVDRAVELIRRTLEAPPQHDQRAHPTATIKSSVVSVRNASADVTARRAAWSDTSPRSHG
jgi:hypothetical protein